MDAVFITEPAADLIKFPASSFQQTFGSFHPVTQKINQRWIPSYLFRLTFKSPRLILYLLKMISKSIARYNFLKSMVKEIQSLPK
jgi:hypothetical protein